MIPGEYFVDDGDIELNVGRRTVELKVGNTGDRPIQVGSHYHFFETNPALDFERSAAYGFRLDIAAGTAVRFEPGQNRTVALVELAGLRRVYGLRGAVSGPLKAIPPKAKAAAPRDDSASAKSGAKTARKPAAKVATKAASKPGRGR